MKNYHIGQLRHAYALIMQGFVTDYQQAVGFSKWYIEPAAVKFGGTKLHDAVAMLRRGDIENVEQSKVFAKRILHPIICDLECEHDYVHSNISSVNMSFRRTECVFVK